MKALKKQGEKYKNGDIRIRDVKSEKVGTAQRSITNQMVRMEVEVQMVTKKMGLFLYIYIFFILGNFHEKEDDRLATSSG